MKLAIALSARSARVGLLTLSALAFAGCARVKPEELSVELAKVRQEMRSEMQQGDSKVAADLGARIDGVDRRLSTLADQLDQLKTTFDVTVERMEGAIRFQAPVFFDFADASVRPTDRPLLDQFASVIKGYYPDVLITAEGFTDPAGSAAYNQKLGLARAESVLDYLADQGGLNDTQLRAVSYGEEKARLMDPTTGPGEPGLRNRRVVLIIEGKDVPKATTTETETDGAL